MKYQGIGSAYHCFGCGKKTEMLIHRLFLARHTKTKHGMLEEVKKAGRFNWWNWVIPRFYLKRYYYSKQVVLRLWFAEVHWYDVEMPIPVNY